MVPVSVTISEKQEAKLAKIGVQEGSDYTFNDKQPDYFCSKSARDLLNLKEKDGRDYVTYDTLDNIKSQVVDVLNKPFARPCIQLCPAPMYLHLKCHFTKCPYQIWFKFDGDSHDPIGMKYFRTINSNHSIQGHKKDDIMNLNCL